MNDLFRQGNVSFEDWVETYSLTNQDPEDKQRFESALVALQRNSALTFLLNKLEATAHARIAMATEETRILDEHRKLQAIRALRLAIMAFVDDRRVEEQKTATKAKK